MKRQKYMVQISDLQYPFVEIAEYPGSQGLHRHVGCWAQGWQVSSTKYFRRLTPKEKQKLALILIAAPNA